jgi:predicted transcriptional regulator
MHTRSGWTTPAVPISSLAAEWLAPDDEDAFAVFDGPRFAGLVSRGDLRRVAPSAWATTRVADVMTPRDGVVSVAPDDEAFVALQNLGSSSRNQLPVVDGDELVGMIRERDIGRWLELLGSREVIVPRPRHA